MSYEEDKDKAVQLKTVVEMFRAYKYPNVSLVYDETTGRYTNESIVEWLDNYADGLVYGVKVPVYSYDPTTMAVKTDANENLILQPSTLTKAGRNDYTDRKLFWCTRVNGGVDPDGMPYVTSIEGIDNRFDSYNNNTFALTPVYYAKYTETEEYLWQQYCDSPKEGFEPCVGAYTHNKELRPYILRACYLDHDGSFSSKSGKVLTTSNRAYSNLFSSNSPLYIETAVQMSDSRTEDGLTYWTLADLTYLNEFMQLMLGIKATVQGGTGIYNYYRGTFTPSQYIKGKSIFISRTDYNKWNPTIGMTVDISQFISTSAGTKTLYPAITIQAISGAAGTGDVELLFDLDEDIDVNSSTRINSTNERTGSLDKIRGTYGFKNDTGINDGFSPCRFQNIEWGLGVGEICINYMRDRQASTFVTKDDPSEDWKVLGDAISRSAVFIKDYQNIHGVRCLKTYGGTSTTGHMVAYQSMWSGSSSATHAGILCIQPNGYTVGYLGPELVQCWCPWNTKSDIFSPRISAVGHSYNPN